MDGFGVELQPVDLGVAFFAVIARFAEVDILMAGCAGAAGRAEVADVVAAGAGRCFMPAFEQEAGFVMVKADVGEGLGYVTVAAGEREFRVRAFLCPSRECHRKKNEAQKQSVVKRHGIHPFFIFCLRIVHSLCTAIFFVCPFPGRGRTHRSWPWAGRE